MNQSLLIIGSTVVAIFMGITMNIMRLRASKKPTNAKKIILPPFFMSSGLLMFLLPTFRVSGLQVLEALLVGALFSYLLIKTTSFTIEENDIYLKPSKAFIFILFGLFALRLVLKMIIGTKIDVGETSGMFYLLALGMIFTWRIAMFVEYMQLKRQIMQDKGRQSIE